MVTKSTDPLNLSGDSYVKIMEKMRDYLMIIINITVGILALYIYPLDRFEDHEILITLTLLVCGGVTFYYLLTIPSSNEWITSVLLLLFLANLSIVSISIDVPFYHTALITTFFLSLFIIRTRLSETISTNFLEIMIGLTYASSLTFWYLKPSSSTSNAYILELAAIQIVLAIIVLVRMRYSKVSVLAILPFIYSFLLTPLISGFTTGISNPNWLTRNYMDFHVYLYGALIVVFLIQLLINYDNLSYYLFYTTHAVTLILLYFVSINYDYIISNYNIDNFDIILSPLSLIITAVSLSLYLTLNKERIKDSRIQYLPLIFLAINLFYILFNVGGLVSPSRIVYLDHSVMAILALLPFILVLRLDHRSYFEVPFQGLLIFMISFLTFDFVQYIHNLLILTYILLIFLSILFRKGDELVRQIYFISASIIISLNGLIGTEIPTENADLYILVLGALIIFSIAHKVRYQGSIQSSIIFAMVPWYFLTLFKNRLDLFEIQGIQFNLLDLGLISLALLYSIYTIKMNSISDAASQVYGLNGLISVLIIFGGIVQSPNSISISILILIQLLPLLSKPNLFLKPNLVYVQSIPVFLYQFVKQTDLEILTIQFNLNTIVYSAFTLIIMLITINKRDITSRVAIIYANLGLMGSYAFFSLSELGLDVTVPFFLTLALVTLIFTATISLAHDDYLVGALTISQSIGIGLLHLFDNYLLLDLDELNTDYLEFNNLEVITSTSIILLVFVSLLLFLNRKKDVHRDYLITTIYLLIAGLTIFNEVLVDTPIVFSAQPYIFLGILLIMTLWLHSNQQSTGELWNIFVLIPILVVMRLNKDQAFLNILDETIYSVSLIYLAVVISSINFRRKLVNQNAIMVFILSSGVILGLFSAAPGLVIQMEFILLPLLGVLLLFTYSEYSQRNYLILYTTITSFVLFLSFNIPPIVDSKLSGIDSFYITNILYLFSSLFILNLTLKTKESLGWYHVITNYLVLVIFGSLFLTTQIHPLIIVVTVILMTFPLIYQNQVYVRTTIPFLNSIALLSLSFRQYEIEISGNSFPVDFILFAVWSNIIIAMWYLRGIRNQLISTISAIFLTAGGYSALYLIDIIENIDPLFIFFILIEVVIINFIYNSRSSALNQIDIYKIVFSSVFSFILISIVIKEVLDDSTLQIYRLLLDWLLFVPIFVQTIIYARPIIDQLFSVASREKEADWKVISIMGLFTIAALIIGAESLFSAKLLVLSIVFWLFAGTLIRPMLSWAASVYSIFTFGFILAQFGDGSGGFVEYFLALAFFGVLMTIFGFVNEFKYVGEPFTASLTISGSVLTAVAVIVPLIINDPFPGVDEKTGLLLTNFIPNVIWAVQGLILFVVSIKLSKDYLRRLALSILMVDIFKTGVNIVIEGDNPLIRIIGAIVLGGVLILIFYLFTQESEEIEEVKANQQYH